MAVDVRPAVLVHRPRGDVAAFMFDPGNDLRWSGGITSSTPAQPGPLVAGVTVARTARFLGRTFTYGYVVTRHESDRLARRCRVTRAFEQMGPIGFETMRMGHPAVAVEVAEHR